MLQYEGRRGHGARSYAIQKQCGKSLYGQVDKGTFHVAKGSIGKSTRQQWHNCYVYKNCSHGYNGSGGSLRVVSKINTDAGIEWLLVSRTSGSQVHLQSHAPYVHGCKSPRGRSEQPMTQGMSPTLSLSKPTMAFITGCEWKLYFGVAYGGARRSSHALVNFCSTCFRLKRNALQMEVEPDTYRKRFFARVSQVIGSSKDGNCLVRITNGRSFDAYEKIRIAILGSLSCWGLETYAILRKVRHFP